MTIDKYSDIVVLKKERFCLFRKAKVRLLLELAENGKFAEAKEWLETALTLAPKDEKKRLQCHLDLVMAEKPVRD